MNEMHALVILIAMDAKFDSGHGTRIMAIVDIQRRNEALKTGGRSASGTPLDSKGFGTVMCGV